ncbi:MAG: zinc-dependent metalloprotease [Balneolaceae bacterium]|nr:zinc-dependent metalloprotease [Balneolaceae bacterium]
MVRWEQKEDNILLRHVSFENVATDSLPVYQAVQNSNFEPIIASFSIEALNSDSTASVIDVTSLYTTDIPSLGLQDFRRQAYQVRRLDGERTFINHIHSYPRNIEVRNLLTYEAGDPPSNSSTGTISLEVNHSMVLLPGEKMTPRPFDQRVGYFSVEKTDYGADAQKAKQIQNITRWKLVPKDKEAYLNGELVEPEEPIVYYIDPATPKKWRPYLKQGIEDWQKAFEAAGFKNAIIAKDPPSEEENPEWTPEDVRYSVIRYFASPVQNAYGPHVHDPRTGQILESDIGWYHNIMNLLRNWYFVQTAAANPEARAVEFDDDVMGNLMRFVAAHEVGHTIGLPHNFGSSYAYPVDSLRSPSFTSTHGTAPSIMDYARFNYIAQPGDGVNKFTPAVGEYDKWAVKWGYTWFPEDMSKEEKMATLNEWTRERADDPRYFYGSSSNDPRSQTEDLTNGAMRAGELGVANLERITDNLITWTDREGANYEELDELYGQIVAQWSRYTGHVLNYIGGVYETDKTYSQEGPVYEFVSEERQRRAMEWLAEHGWASPEWMLNHEVLDRINESSVVDDIRSRQVSLLNNVAEPGMLGRLIEWDARSENDTYTPFELMDDLRGAIWSELEDSSPEIDVFRRNLQRGYLERMEYLMTQEPSVPPQFAQYFDISVDVSQSDIRPIVREQLILLQDDIEDAVDNAADRSTRVHLQDVQSRIQNILDTDD